MRNHRLYGKGWQARAKRWLVGQACACGAPATDVDHILPLNDGGSNDPSNWQALCHAHHSAKTARTQPAGWARKQVRQATPAASTVVGGW